MEWRFEIGHEMKRKYGRRCLIKKKLYTLTRQNAVFTFGSFWDSIIALIKQLQFL
jgi:hypothetical protein